MYCSNQPASCSGKGKEIKIRQTVVSIDYQNMINSHDMMYALSFKTKCYTLAFENQRLNTSNAPINSTFVIFNNGPTVVITQARLMKRRKEKNDPKVGFPVTLSEWNV